MSDIDFDELDRAVASVLSKDGTPVPAPTTQPTPTTIPTAPLIPVEPKAPAANAFDLHKTAPTAPRGRFLDMVSPSGDMARPAAAPALAPTKPSVMPAAAPVFATEPVIAAPVTAAPPVIPQPAVQTFAPPVPTVVTPAPVQVAPQPVAPADANDFFAASPDDSAPHDVPNVPPVASPFIPDAKVEKRPLGGGSPAVPMFAPTPVTPPTDALHAQISKIESEDNVLPESVPPYVPPQPAVPVAAPNVPVEPAPVQTAPVQPTPPAPVVEAPAGPDPASEPSVVTVSETPVSEIAPSPAKAPETGSNRSIQPLSVMEAPAFFTHKEPPKPVEDLPKHGKGSLIWITVGAAILLIGFGVGASLYFVVLR